MTPFAWAVIATVIAFVVAVIRQPKEFRIERSVAISGALPVVYAQVEDFDCGKPGLHGLSLIRGCSSPSRERISGLVRFIDGSGTKKWAKARARLLNRFRRERSRFD